MRRIETAAYRRPAEPGRLCQYVFEAVDPTVKQTVSDRVLELAGTFVTPSTVEDIVRPTVDRVIEQGSGGLAAISFAVSSKVIRIHLHDHRGRPRRCEE